MLEPLLAALVGASSGAAAVAAGASGNANGAPAALNPYVSASGTAALLALQHICGVALPQQGIEISADLQQIQQEMSVDDISVASLLSQPDVMDRTGVVMTDDYGQPVFDFQVGICKQSRTLPSLITYFLPMCICNFASALHLCIADENTCGAVLQPQKEENFVTAVAHVKRALHTRTKLHGKEFFVVTSKCCVVAALGPQPSGPEGSSARALRGLRVKDWWTGWPHRGSCS